MKSESQRETGFRRKSSEISAAIFPVRDLLKTGSQESRKSFIIRLEVTPVIINFKLQNVTLAILRMHFRGDLFSLSLIIRKRLVVTLKRIKTKDQVVQI